MVPGPATSSIQWRLHVIRLSASMLASLSAPILMEKAALPASAHAVPSMGKEVCHGQDSNCRLRRRRLRETARTRRGAGLARRLAQGLAEGTQRRDRTVHALQATVSAVLAGRLPAR